MTFPSATDHNQLSCSQTWWQTQPFLTCQCNMIILLGSLTHLDIPGMQAQHLTYGIHLAQSCENYSSAEECRSDCETCFIYLVHLIHYSPSIWSQLISCPAKGMPPRSRQCMRNVSAINTEIIIFKFWALYTIREHKTSSAKGLCFRTWILKRNIFKWEVSLLGVSKAIPKHFENPGLLLRSPNI